MKLYILRHGQTDYNLQGRFQGQIDVPLNENGKNQAIEALKIFKDVDIDVIFSSPLSRAKDTVKKISEYKNIDIIIDNRIIERSFGNLEGKYSVDNLEKYNIENMMHLKQRVFSFLNDIIKEYNDKNVLVATHEGIAKVVEIFFYGEEAGKNFRLKNGEYKIYYV